MSVFCHKNCNYCTECFQYFNLNFNLNFLVPVVSCKTMCSVRNFSCRLALKSHSWIKPRKCEYNFMKSGPQGHLQVSYWVGAHQSTSSRKTHFQCFTVVLICCLPVIIFILKSQPTSIVNMFHN